MEGGGGPRLPGEPSLYGDVSWETFPWWLKCVCVIGSIILLVGTVVMFFYAVTLQDLKSRKYRKLTRLPAPFFAHFKPKFLASFPFTKKKYILQICNYQN